jgi:hypothetical protein
VTLKNPLQRLCKHFDPARYGRDDILADIDEEIHRDKFVTKVLQNLPNGQVGGLHAAEVEEDALAFWFWWKLS